MKDFDSAKKSFDNWTATVCASQARMEPVGGIPPKRQAVHVAAADMVDAFLLQHPNHKAHSAALLRHAEQMRATDNGGYILDSQVWDRTRNRR